MTTEYLTADITTRTTDSGMITADRTTLISIESTDPTIIPVYDNQQVILQGSTNILSYEWKIGNDAENADPVDITGSSIACHFRRSVKNSLYSHGSKLVFSGTGTIVNPIAGKFIITIDAATTETFNPKEDEVPLVFQVEITLAGRTDRVIEGVAMFKKQATF